MKIPDGGPIAMEVVLTEVEGARLSGGIHVDGKEITRHDETFDMDLQWYEHALSVRQRIVPEKDGVWMVKGYVRYMCCDDQSCLPPEKKNFEFKGKEHKSEAAEARSETEMSDPLLEKEEGVSDEAGPKEDWWSPTTWKGETGNEGNLSGFGTNRRSLWLLFLSGILGGLLALLTPCVWPILPMTVSFFLKRGASRRSGVRDAVLYALSIVVVYVGLGLIVALLFGADALNTVATNAWVNILFFVLFVVFALSFFGLFEIQLPGSWSTALNHQAEKTKGFLSIQLMALVLVIVSFSCTGPIVGSLLVEAATASSSGFLSPLVGMLGFALALAMPFGLCALFPDFLKRLPKSGGWMETVKVILVGSER
jgi:thiol:disulfide interchange protein DsbD